MNSRHKRIVLIDQTSEMNQSWLTSNPLQQEELVLLDPITLFRELDWTCYEDDVLVINTVYSRLFEEVVMNNKQLVCFWPLSGSFGDEWFELASLCKKNSLELDLYKSSSLEDDPYGLSDAILRTWKGFVYFILESLLEDIHLNEQFDEIATLTSGQETIVLFKLESEEGTRYAYTFDSEYFELSGAHTSKLEDSPFRIPSFESFNEMLASLLKENDLSLFDSKFMDGRLEKAYFSALAKEFKTKNLIENWIATYSLN